jgi:hypothetical protein
VHCAGADEGWNSQTSLHLERDSIWTLVRSEFAVGFDESEKDGLFFWEVVERGSLGMSRDGS